ncbi:MAG TPA: sigma 54-interacting transcriptional regulator [Vicinamibacterales bacterium]|nr:sigma 54-interacting transcriptional regulator [Vicinamibacterales bacterium]
MSDPVLDHEAVSRSRDQLRLLSEVSEAVASHGDLTALFRDLARRLPAVVPFEIIALFLHDPEKDVMRVHMLGTAEADRIPPGLEVPVAASFSGTVFTTQQPVVVRSPEDADRFPQSQSLVREIGLQSFCMLPLTTIVRRLGAIGFGSLRPYAFGESELEFLDQVSRQVAVAVDNVLHDESNKSTQLELSQERDRLRLLLDVSESIASYRDLKELFHVLGQRLPRLVPFDFINLVLHDPARDVMRLEILTTGEPSSIQPGRETPVDESPSGIVWKTQQPLMIGDLAEEMRFPALTPLLLENRVRSYCAVPLTTALRRLGALGFGSLQPNAYTASDLEFMQHVAKQVAVAVDNVLHDKSARVAQEQLARERDRLRLLLEINNAVVAHLGMDEMLEAIGASLGRVIQHDGCGLVLFDPETRTYRCHVLKSDGKRFTEEGPADETACSAGSAMASGEPAVLGEQELRAMASDSDFVRRLLEKGVRSFTRIPLRSHDRVLGSLNLGRLRDAAFTPEDVDLLNQVARQLAIAVENGIAYREIAELKEKLNKEKLYLEEEIRTTMNFGEIIGESVKLKQALQQIEIVAPTDSTVLIQGETGTGKELIARAIHNLSGRKERTFVKLNCAAIPTGLLESELFGHEKGAFTGAIAQKVGRVELAHGGTLFLDEVGDIPLELQSKFLRVLQEQEFERLGGTRTIRVDFRLVAATNRDLPAMVADREFRSDLYYRLNVFPVVSPPLRDRRDDVPRLVRHFTQKFARRMSKPIVTISAETMTALSEYYWPGNIRELENFIERAVILSRGSSLDAPLSELKQRSVVAMEPASDVSRPLSTLEDAEREHIRRALQEANWLVGGPSGAAARLGMKRTTLQSKMARLGIQRP